VYSWRRALQSWFASAIEWFCGDLSNIDQREETFHVPINVRTISSVICVLESPESGVVYAGDNEYT